MRDRDTSMGGRRHTFPSTVLSDIRAAADPSSPKYRERLSVLFRAYWRPVFAYIRAGWSKKNEDAKDATQAFFAHLLSKAVLARFDAGRGSFRTYLRLSLRHFLIDHDRAERSRRPEGQLFSLDIESSELDELMPAASDEPPEDAYDRAWFRCLFDAAVADLESELAAERKDAYRAVFRAYYLRLESEPTYAQVAQEVGVKESDVRNYLTNCRTRLKEILRVRIADYAQGAEDVERELLRAMGR